MLNLVGVIGAIAAIIGIWLLACDRRNEFIGPFLIAGLFGLAVRLAF